MKATKKELLAELSPKSQSCQEEATALDIKLY
jgi:hypothetical protein